MNINSYQIPLPKPGNPRGEDVILYKNNVIGVIDGVGGSSIRDGPKWKWKLCMDVIREFIKKIDTKLYLPFAVSSVIKKIDTSLQGTFTCAIIQFNKKYATILVIGDSQLLIVRDNELYYKSKITRDNCNIPSQIGILDRRVIDIFDNDIVLHNLLLKRDDKIIMYTDGVLDNISIDDILNSNTAKEVCYKSFISGKKKDDITCVIVNVK